MSDVHILNMQHPAVQYLCSKDKRLAKLIAMVGDIKYQTQPDCFARLVRSIINQMLSNKVAHVIGNRVAGLCGGDITPENLLKLNREQLRSTGLSYTKADNILGIAKAATDGSLDFSNFPNMTDEEVMKELTRLRGIGAWSAKMYLIFTLNRMDVLPYEDGAFLQTYAWLYKTNDLQPAAIIKRCKKWKPYSAIAARYFYYALDMGLTKQDFHLFK
ncbi:MAG: DNA-3-methyladenine glycosylase 2 family protein [Succiniclasticum sp.]|uniref:DNA-3-methyladenine glycosylase family protein n=1 Tax=Succiniclasticum sp. TaxID=2775030 RepID=UPI002A9152A7|nr:DNA-3-methyladenine glycosylase 2 family protein [Succiniclasticum sp.]MDY6292001.1 DNA-3-methyladenine glycosylase 2 family protein [Succiniclasticum sp.]